MDRRIFVKNGALAGISLASLSLAACQINPPAKKTDKPSTDELNLDELTIPELQEKVKSGSLTSVAMTRIYLKRMEELDKAGPILNSVIEINADALSMAEKMDQERMAGKSRGPLHGIP